MKRAYLSLRTKFKISIIVWVVSGFFFLGSGYMTEYSSIPLIKRMGDVATLVALAEKKGDIAPRAL